jgi:hypothetical protein
MNTINMRLQEATAILDTVCDQEVLAQADLWHWEQEQQKAWDAARKRDQDELQYWFSFSHYYRGILSQWMFQQSEEARTALERRKTWGYRMLLFLACWVSGGLFLIMEVRAIQQLQSKRDNPPFGEQQRLWLRMVQDAQRNIYSLASLQAPRPTPWLKECDRRVISLRRWLDSLSSQIQVQQTRVQVLQQQRAQQRP